MAGKTSTKLSIDNPGRSHSVPVSLYDYHKKVVTEYKKNAGLQKESQALQKIIEFFDKTYGKTFIKNIVVFIIYPGIISFILYLIAHHLYDLSNSMVEAGLPFEALSRFAGIVNLISISFTGFTVVSVIMFVMIVRKRGY